MGFDFNRLMNSAAAQILGTSPEESPAKPAAPAPAPAAAPAARPAAAVQAPAPSAPVLNFSRPTRITLSLARLLMGIVEKQAADMGVNAVVAVADAGGNVISADCMDDAFIASYDIAVNKAFTAVSLKMSTAELAPLAAPGQPLYGIQFTNSNRIVIFGGGIPLKSEGTIIGGLGVSGGTAEQDTFLAEFGRRVFDELVK